MHDAGVSGVLGGDDVDAVASRVAEFDWVINLQLWILVDNPARLYGLDV